VKAIALRAYSRRLGRVLVHEDLLVIALGVLALCVFATTSKTLAQDGWFALVGGRAIIEHGLPYSNTWTVWGRGHTWIDQEWLGQVILYGLWWVGGLKTALVALALIGLGTFALACAFARRLGGSVIATLGVALLAILTVLNFFSFRTQLLALPLFVVVAYLLIADSRKPSKRVWWVFPLLIFWANVHGSMPLGAGLVSLRGATMLFEKNPRPRPRLRALAFLLAPVCVFLTPYGLSVLSYYRQTVGNSWFARVVTEWAPTTLSLYTLGFYLALLLSAVVVGRRWLALSWFERLALLAVGAFGLVAVRDIIWFVLLALLIVPGLLTGLVRERENRAPPPVAVRQTVLVVLGVFVALFFVSALTQSQSLNAQYRTTLARAVAITAREHVRAHVFADVAYSDYLLWTQPSLSGRIVYDARFELLSSQQARSAVKIVDGIDVQQVLAVGEIVVLPRFSKTAQQVIKERNWRVLYRDSATVVAIRERA